MFHMYRIVLIRIVVTVTSKYTKSIKNLVNFARKLGSVLQCVLVNNLLVKHKQFLI